MGIEPKPGTGWVAGKSPDASVQRWRVLLDAGVYLLVAVTDEFGFIISRVEDANSGTPRHSVPMPEDLGRIEHDFGVRAWSIGGVHPVFPPSVGQALWATAVDERN